MVVTRPKSTRAAPEIRALSWRFMTRNLRRPVPRIDPDFCRYPLRLAKSRIHGWGVYAGSDIPANRKVIEYTGEKISRRNKQREEESVYLFTLDRYWMIDGAVNGSGAEFINHCCEPNLVTRIMKGQIIYFSRRAIRKGEELTVDYNFGPEDERTPCHCGAHGCRGTINLK
jgi:SET domain-containing protein